MSVAPPRPFFRLSALNHALLVLLVAAGTCAAPDAWPQTAPEQVLTPILVSASRFADNADAAPAGAIVIDAEQIRQSGADDVNQAIRSIGGIVGRQNNYGTSDLSFDLRGFGATADQNTVILVDGVRLSENELSIALLSSIPIETVQRIEIVRGGSSVLYGAGATAGSIQIVTKRPRTDGVADAAGKTGGTLVAEAGSYGQRSLRAAVNRVQQGWSLDANLARLESDNYRDNNNLRQENVGAGVQWSDGSRRIGLRVDNSDQHFRTAGGLSMAQYLNNPRSTDTPDDYGAMRVNRVVLSGEQQIGALELAAELAQRDKNYASFSASLGGYASRSRTTQFSPRLRYSSAIGKTRNALVAGLDFQESSRHVANVYSRAIGQQRSQALYLRDQIQHGGAQLAFGARREIFEQKNNDPLAFDPAGNYDRTQGLTAWEVEASALVLPQVKLFGKAGRSYRVANIDENGFTAQPGQTLLPQTSNDLALGVELGNAKQALTATLFQHRLRNEIMYDPTIGFGANANLDPTLRRGVELEMRSQLNGALALSASFQHIDARFREGSNAGKEVVLVPRNSASARLNWNAGRQSAWTGVQWVASQRYGDDFTNSCVARIPAYATLEARYALRLAQWELALSGLNLTNKNYFNEAYSCQGGIYPAAGRQVNLSVRRDF